MKKIIFIQIFFLSISIFSQSDSIKSALEFYPLHIGDYWQYKVIDHTEYANRNDTSWIGFKEVIGDTVLSNGKSYFIIKEEKLPLKFLGNKFLIRIDSSTANVYYFLYPGDIMIDSLLAKKGDKVIECHTCLEETTKTYFGLDVETKLIDQTCVSSTSYDGWELAKKIGEVMRYYNDVSFVSFLSKCDLIYAKINGIEYGTKVDVKEITERPEKFILFQNFPNPFNPSTTFRFILPVSNKITFTIYNSLGQEITTLIDKYCTFGEHQIKWNAFNAPSGVYFYRLQTSKYSITKKFMLLK